MTEKLKQIAKEEISKLPKERQGIINATGWEKITEEISNKYLLDEEGLNELQIETLLVLIGLEDPHRYTNHIIDNAGVETERAEKITTEVFDKIFIPMSKEMELSVKENLKIQNPSWDQTIDFIISGGDYSYFVKK